jgi:hypothetical protein
VTGRFPIRIDAVWRPFLLVGGVREQTAYVDVGEDAITVRFGWLFNQTMARDDIEGAGRVSWPWWAGIGLRLLYFSGGVGLTGSYNGVVEIRFRARRRLWGFTGCRRLAVSLEEPERFLQTLGVPTAAA